MRIVLAGDYPERTEARIRSRFPEEWELRIAGPEQLPRELPRADVLLPEHLAVTRELLRLAPGLKLIQTGAGCDNVDLAACAEAGVPVCRAPGVNAAAVAQQVMAYLLCWYRNLLPLDRGMKAGLPEKELDYTGAELSEKTIGLVGLGMVGRQVAALCAAFGMRVLGCSRSGRPAPGVELRDLDALLRESDIVSLHVPLTGSTRGLIDGAALRKMKPDALLINTSRGAVVREKDLIPALRRGEIGGACLDVFEEEPLPLSSPLRELENVILTPHTAGYPDGYRYHEKRWDFFVGNIRRIERGEEPEGRADPG